MRIALRNCEYAILNILDTSGSLHGYGILQALQSFNTPIPPATLYAALRRLRCLNLVNVERVTTNMGPVRNIHHITYQGRAQLCKRNNEILLRVEELHTLYKSKLLSLRQLL